MASGIGAQGSAGIPARTWSDLDWAAIQGRLAELTVGQDARELAADLGVLPDDVWAERQLEVEEMSGLLRRGAQPPLAELPSLRHALVRARRVEALEPDDLLLVASALETAHRVRRHGASHEAVAPRYAACTAWIADLTSLTSEIRRTFDAAGLIVDDATPELARLRRRARRLRDSILARMDRYLKTPRFEGILQDDYITLREDRYVLPVRAGERGDVPGIVHGASNSGATLFIEPEDLIPLNNDLQVAQAEVRAEERRVLVRLTRLVRDAVDPIELNADLLTWVDLTVAAARMAAELDATRARVAPDAPFALTRARHPVLALRALTEGFTVIPNDITLPPGSRALVISGPNTGGKTVILKTLGLFALMTRAGMLVPCEAGSSMPLFDQVWTDIGDGQSIQGDLSTFSGHVANIASFVEQAGPRSLILIDEIFAGTDPVQGTALSRALLGWLMQRGAFSVVTTHLEGLKSISFEDDRYACASMGFDIERFQPTYRLRIGTPGASWALRIAERLGMPSAIIRAAEAGPEGDTTAEAEEKLVRMEQAWRDVLADREQARQLAAEASADRDRAAAELERARNREERAANEEATRLRRELSELRTQLREATRRLKALGNREPGPISDDEQRAIDEARELARAVDERTRAALQPEQQATEGLTWADLSRHMDVWVVPFQMYGRIAEEPVAGQKVSVQMGAVHAFFTPDQLRRGPGAARDDGRTAAQPQRHAAFRSAAPSRTLDVRGARVDDAVEQLDAFLEQAELSSMHEVLVIHGHGTGALKRALRSHLNTVRHPITSRPGEPGEGGDGVTVVTFTTRTTSGS